MLISRIVQILAESEVFVGFNISLYNNKCFFYLDALLKCLFSYSFERFVNDSFIISESE